MRNTIIGLMLSGLVGCTCAPPEEPDAGVDAGSEDTSLDAGLELDGGGVDGGSTDAGPMARWTALQAPGRRYHSLTWDGDLGRVVMFGGWLAQSPLADMWEWDGTTWTERKQATAPSPRANHAVAWDSARHRLVLFGGGTFVREGPDGGAAMIPTGDTWEYDGVSWLERTPITAPSARWGHEMAYDTARQRVVLVGGFADATSFETWEWDGTNWARRAPSTSMRYSDGLAYDEVRARVVLFTGTETWEWDGSAWLRKPSAQPPTQASTHLAWDPLRRRVVLTGAPSDTWEWDGLTWRAVAGTVSPRNSQIAFDWTRGRMVVFGGAGPDLATLGDTWERDGTTWSQHTAPSRLWGRQLAYDEARRRVMTFGGNALPRWFPPWSCTNGTWEWGGLEWVQRLPATSPPPLCGGSLAYDRARERVVMFGGMNVDGTWTADTWEWDGVDWTRRSPATSPSPRAEQGMAFDEARGRMVLFGGWNGAALADVWEWDGTNWTERFPPLSPPPHRRPSMAYDQARRRVVVTGGPSGTWEWDGAVWSGGGAVPGFATEGVIAMAWDPMRGSMVAYATVSGPPLKQETWERDGTVWARRTLAPGSAVPAASASDAVPAGAMVWDGERQRMMLSGADTWFYDP